MKNKKIYILFMLLIVIFSIGIVRKEMQNDTFFTIPIGEFILENKGLDGYDHWSFHENLKFTHSGWIFDLFIVGAYNTLGFLGIYILMMIITIFIAIILFNTLLKEKNGLFLSFVITIILVYISTGVFAARGQIFSFLIFVLEMYAIRGLLDTGKKRYFITLLILPIVLANTHDTVWPIYFVILLPYIAEGIVNKIKILKTDEPYKIVIEEEKHLKKLVIIMCISLFTGMLTPVFGTAYINMITVMKGVSKTFIAELQTVGLLDTLPLLVIIFLIVGIIGFTKTKVRLKDLLFVFGFSLMALMANRNIYFLYLLGSISICNIITAFLNTYNVNCLDSVLNKKVCIILLTICMLLFSLLNFLNNINSEFVNTMSYPVEATKWMKKNIDISKMRIYNNFNYGSYLELNGIKVFVDSRSGIYCEEFNDTEVMNDYLELSNNGNNYEEIFEKYGITHLLLYNDEELNKKIFEDENYKRVYQDDTFVIYEKR